MDTGPTGPTRTDPVLTEGGPTERGPARTAAASARNRLATEVRRVTDLLVGRLIDDDDLDRAAVDVAGVERLPKPEQRMLELVDGERTVREIVTQSHMSGFDACKILYQLIEARLVRRRAS